MAGVIRRVLDDDSRWSMTCGDSLEVLKDLPDGCIDSCVTDPPYGLSFMDRKWDYDVPRSELWSEVFRVLKPGGHVLAFFGSRTYHRGVVEIEDAGFEIRDQLMWLYGNGYAKSLNVAKDIDKKAGVEPVEVKKASLGMANNPNWNALHNQIVMPPPTTEDAQKWAGWGSALKPAHEPITLARKPLDGTITENILEHGTGGLNVDGCRVPTLSDTARSTRRTMNGATYIQGELMLDELRSTAGHPDGRFPANVIHDGSPDVVDPLLNVTAAKGGAARFFYCAKASRKEKNEGVRGDGNSHPTVKPVALMRYLLRLVTPPNGVALDPFAGSGTTGVGALLEGFRFVGVELDRVFCDVAKQRIRDKSEEFRDKANSKGPRLPKRRTEF